MMCYFYHNAGGHCEMYICRKVFQQAHSQTVYGPNADAFLSLQGIAATMLVGMAR